MPTLPHGPPKRWLLPRAHAGTQAPDELGQKGGQGAEGREARCQYAGRGHDGRGAGAQERGQDWETGVQDYEDEGSVDEAVGVPVPAAVSGDYAWGQAEGEVHVGV